MNFGEPNMNKAYDQPTPEVPDVDGEEKNKPEEANEQMAERQENFGDLENEIDEAMREDEEFSEEYENKRVAEWKEKPEKEKKETINEKRLNLEKNLKEDVEIPEDVLRETNKLQKYQEDLREKAAKSIEERGDLLERVYGQLNGDIDISKLGPKERAEFNNIFSVVKNVTQDTLNVEKIDYCLETKKDNLGDLLNRHEDREIAMEKLEYTLEQCRELEEYLAKLESMTKEQQEAAKEDIQKMVDKMIEIAEKEPGLFEKLKEAGIIAGIIILASALGVAGVNVLIGFLKGAVGTVAKFGFKKIAVGTVGAFTIANPGAVAGAIVGGGALFKIMSWLSNEKNRDNLAEWVCGGAKLPGYAHWASGKSSEKK